MGTAGLALDVRLRAPLPQNSLGVPFPVLAYSCPYPRENPLVMTRRRSRAPASRPLAQAPFSFLVQERPECREGPLHQEARSRPQRRNGLTLAPSRVTPEVESEPIAPLTRGCGLPGRQELRTHGRQPAVPRGQVPGLTGFPQAPRSRLASQLFPVQLLRVSCRPPIRAGLKRQPG